MLLKDADELPKEFKNGTLEVATIDQLSEEVNEAVITEVIREQLNRKVFSKQQFKTMEEFCKEYAQENEIFIDECCTEVIQQGLEWSNRVSSLVEGGKSIKPNAKKLMLPLQGKDMWRAWGDFNKEVHRLKDRGNESVNDYAGSIETKKASIRQHQDQFVRSLTPLMNVFIESLLTLEGLLNRSTRNFFLQWLKLNLNSLSEGHVSGLQIKYEDTRKKLLDLQAGTVKARQDNNLEIEQCREKLTGLKKDIVDASFGLQL